jgi:D-arabinose 1-dehydrogenase-like Zn-dependent alcohol dehydrogenase
VVIGLGGLGLNAVAISVMLGAKTYGIDIKASWTADASTMLTRRAGQFDRSSAQAGR